MWLYIFLKPPAQMVDMIIFNDLICALKLRIIFSFYSFRTNFTETMF